MENKHTAGKWQLGLNPVTEQISVMSETGKSISFLNYTKHRADNNWEEQEANAKLIAAAPELLEALKELSKQVSINCSIGSDPELLELCKKHQKALAAINKATN